MPFRHLATLLNAMWQRSGLHEEGPTRVGPLIAHLPRPAGQLSAHQQSTSTAP